MQTLLRDCLLIFSILIEGSWVFSALNWTLEGACWVDWSFSDELDVLISFAVISEEVLFIVILCFDQSIVIFLVPDSLFSGTRSLFHLSLFS